AAGSLPGAGFNGATRSPAHRRSKIGADAARFARTFHSTTCHSKDPLRAPRRASASGEVGLPGKPAIRKVNGVIAGVIPPDTPMEPAGNASPRPKITQKV